MLTNTTYVQYTHTQPGSDQGSTAAAAYIQQGAVHRRGRT